MITQLPCYLIFQKCFRVFSQNKLSYFVNKHMPKEIEILIDAKTCQSDASKNSSFNNTDIFSVFY